MKLLTYLSVMLFAFALMTRAAHAADELKKGDAAPDFELKGSDGKLHHLKDFKDKKAVVLAWFPRAFTGGCTAECKSLKEEGEAIRKFDVVYFTASTDAIEATTVSKGNKAFAESLEADYPILSDPEGKTAKEYGVLMANGAAANRWTFFIGKDGKILAIDKEVNSEIKDGHYGQKVADKLKELKIAEKK
ncbi:MAG TPA: redoxin domain-containing protein [Pirellulales bacterium]|jgi:peroxiredoxin Q/BCP